MILLLAAVAFGAAVDPRLPPYDPRPVSPPRRASYLGSDGTIAIVGYNDMRGMLESLDQLFVSAHPGFRFRLVLKGTATAAPALTYGVSAFAPMGAEFSALEREAYDNVVGGEPLAIRVAHDPPSPQALSGPICVFVNRANPLEKLSVPEVARIFSVGYPGGPLTRWGELGLAGPWAEREIHPVGTGGEIVAGISADLVRHHFGGHPLALDGLTHGRGAPSNVDRVEGDPSAIGLGTGNLVRPDRVRILAIGPREGGPYVPMTAENIVAGRYPFDRPLLIYLRPDLDPWIVEYLRMVLSKEGQERIAATRPGYLPLNAAEAAEERRKLENLRRRPIDGFRPSREGAAWIACSEELKPLLIRLIPLFQARHPEVALRLFTRDSTTIAIGAVAAGVSAVAPLERETWPLEDRPFRQAFGHPPADVRIGRVGLGGNSRAPLPAIYVNRRNPLSALSLGQAGRIFTLGDPAGDIRRWGQLGLTGGWAGRGIHPYGPIDDGGAATGLRYARFHGRPFARDYDQEPSDDEVLAALAADPDGIAFAEGRLRRRPPEGVRRVLRLPHYLHLYLNGGWGREFARVALSPEGQAAVAAEKTGSLGLAPLGSGEIQAEEAKLGR